MAQYLTPFTNEELEEIQLFLTDRILAINMEANQGIISTNDAFQQIQRLSKTVEKCHSSKHQNLVDL